MEKIFVYGTLKRGKSNSGLLRHANYLGDHVTKDKYAMVSLGAFPAVVLHGDTHIHGEVFEVSEATFKSVDRLEGYPSFYSRMKIMTEHGNAWMYYLGKDSNYVTGRDVVESGVWE